MSTPKRPGWYPAPDRNGEQWWNGVSWSESRRSHRAIPPAASVAYNAQTGFYGTPGAPTAVPGALAGSYQAPGAPASMPYRSMTTPAWIAVALGVASFFFSILAIPAFLLAVAIRILTRVLGGARANGTVATFAVIVSAIALLLLST